MSRPPLLLDTCTAIWLANGDELNETSQAAMRQALADGESLAVSPITAWEIGMLAARQRLALTKRPQAWFRALMAQPGLRLADMDTDILLASCELPGDAPRDPADRIIIATAREGGFRLITRDLLILKYADAGYVDVLAC